MVLKYNVSLSCILFMILISTHVEAIVSDVETTEARDKIDNLFRSSIEEYSIDFTPINNKLRFFGLPEVEENNIVVLILANYGKTIDDIVDIILISNGDVSEIVRSSNSIFQCELIYIQDGHLKIDLDHLKRIIDETKDNQIKQLTENHGIIGYLLKKLIDSEHEKYASTIEDEANAINIPVEALSVQIKTILEESKNSNLEDKSVHRSFSLREVANPNDNVLDRILKDLRGSINTIAITTRDNLKTILKDLITRIGSFYITEPPKNALENIYVTVINTFVEQFVNIALYLDKSIDTLLQPVITGDQTKVQRFIRDVTGSEDEGFFRRLIRQANQFIKGAIKSVIVTVDRATGSIFANILSTVQALADGVIDRVLPIR